VRRRNFITGLGSTAALGSVAARAQPQRVRRIGIVHGLADTDLEIQSRVAAFRQQMGQLGWLEGKNIRYEIRGIVANPDNARRAAADLLKLAPDVVVMTGPLLVEAMQSASPATPIVFVGLTDPVGAGFVESLARPGGSTTGFTSFEYGLSIKWLELLKEIAPGVTHVGVLRQQGVSTGIGMWAAMQVAAPSLKLELKPIGVRDEPEIERGIAAFARGSNGGLVITVGGATIRHRGLISAMASRHQLPAIYPNRYYVISGGLASYGPDIVDQYRRAAAYVDRILKGAKPADLPVETPTKYQLVINNKAAKSLGLTVPSSLLARADEVIE
jgi:putative tryptophan/tyrosine transport system substrate-binding protein